jgi:Cell division protein FtsI/penicillin-binding protein 2
VLDIVRLIPRGTIYDRRGVPLATDDPSVIADARQTYATLGVSVDDTCPMPGERCYPLGGAAFHLLGDARTRVNWTAPNSSYIERDAERELRGFDDHAEVVHTTDSAGRSMLTIRRDYRDLLPVLRHRYDPASAAWARFQQPHDVHLTVDANLQLRVAGIVAAYAQKSAGKAAAVVLDPDSGELLASVSYPWPDASTSKAARLRAFGASARRARGRPIGKRERRAPGSRALRLVPSGIDVQARDGIGGAASASRSAQNDVHVRAAAGRKSGRENQRWNRPVRDDVMDANPHGTIDVHGGFVHSCNAFFAQLAVKLGSRALLDTAESTGDFADAGSRRCGACAPDASADRLRPGRCRRDAPEAGARVGRRRVERVLARRLAASRMKPPAQRPIGF